MHTTWYNTPGVYYSIQCVLIYTYRNKIWVVSSCVCISLGHVDSVYYKNLVEAPKWISQHTLNSSIRLTPPSHCSDTSAVFSWEELLVKQKYKSIHKGGIKVKYSPVGFECLNDVLNKWQRKCLSFDVTFVVALVKYVICTNVSPRSSGKLPYSCVQSMSCAVLWCRGWEILTVALDFWFLGPYGGITVWTGSDSPWLWSVESTQLWYWLNHGFLLSFWWSFGYSVKCPVVSGTCFTVHEYCSANLFFQ